MIIEGPDQVTDAVLSEIARAPNPRFREVMTALVKHLHAFIREARLTEEEFHQACAIINSIGQSSNTFHNEAVLASGSLGVSTLVCLLNNGNHGATETTANLLGPFWRLDSPRTESGGSIIRSPTPGPELFCNIQVNDRSGKPVAGAEVDVWQS
jgi:catechol 1,2-dioxygenase